MGYLFSAVVIIWLLILGFVLTMWKKQNRIWKEIEQLKRLIDENSINKSERNK